MFHLMLVLPILICVVIMFSVFLFGVSILIAGIIGGASTALLIKDKVVKRLIFIGCGIVSFVGLICALPIVSAYTQMPEYLSLTVAMVAALLCIAILSVLGVKFSAAIQNEGGRAFLKITFWLILIAAVCSAAFLSLGKLFLLSL